MKKLSLSLVICLLSLICIGSFAEASYPLKVIDDLDNLVMISEKPQRIVSLAPSHTEILFALGVGERLVGRTDFCDFPLDVQQISSIGGYSQPSIETIMAVQPDLVLASFGNPLELLDQLRDFGIPVLGYDSQTLDDTLKLIWEIGKVTGSEEEAAQLILEIKERISVITKLVSTADKPLVFWEIWHDPLYTAGPNTFIDDLITLAGGINVAADAAISWPTYSLEVLLIKNPEVYIINQGHSQEIDNIAQRPGYSQLKAVQNNRVYLIDSNTVNRPGPRLIDGLEEIARCIHPEVFE